MTAGCCWCFRATCQLISSWGNTTSCSLLMWLKLWGKQGIGGSDTGNDIMQSGVPTGERRLCFSEGNLLLLNDALSKHETFFIRCGIFLILEKLKIITYRNLFKKVWVRLHSSPSKFNLRLKLNLLVVPWWILAFWPYVVDGVFLEPCFCCERELSRLHELLLA